MDMRTALVMNNPLFYENIFFPTIPVDSRLFCWITERAISDPMGVKQIHVLATYNFDLDAIFITFNLTFL